MSNVHYLSKASKIEQLDLFGYQKLAYHKYFLFDIANTNQKGLVSYIEKFEASHIYDTRLLPVFRKPKFDYNFLFNFFERKEISYISILDKDKGKAIEQTKQKLKMASLVRNQLNLLIIFDKNQVEDAVTVEYRSLLENTEDTYEAILNS